jgi:putative transposase
MCSVLGVSRAGFYAWERRAPCDRELADAWLTEKIRAIHARSRGTYGSRRIHAELRLEHGVRVGKKRVERLMALAGLSGILARPRKRTTIRVQGVRTPPDLVDRDFEVQAPDRLWSADITYIWTLEGWLFLAHVEDLFSRKIVGWEMAEHMRKELVVAALEMAVSQRKPDAGCIHHSDQGSQYTAVVFGERCARAGITPSTGSKGDCLDNACSESFHATLKKELIYRHTWATRAEARSAIFEYIEGWYNPHRRHSTLGYLSPAGYEQAHHENAPQTGPAGV